MGTYRELEEVQRRTLLLQGNILGDCRFFLGQLEKRRNKPGCSPELWSRIRRMESSVRSCIEDIKRSSGRLRADLDFLTDRCRRR